MMVHEKGKQLYEKVGHRYKKFNDPCGYSGLGHGAYLIIIEDGCTSVRQMLYPQYADVEAAIHTCKTAMVRTMMEMSRSKPSSRPLTRRERRAHKAYCEVMGKKCGVTFTIPSATEVVDAGIKALREKMGVPYA